MEPPAARSDLGSAGRLEPAWFSRREARAQARLQWGLPRSQAQQMTTRPPQWSQWYRRWLTSGSARPGTIARSTLSCPPTHSRARDERMLMDRGIHGQNTAPPAADKMSA